MNKSALFFKRGYGRIIIIIIIIIIGLLEDSCGSGFLLNKWGCKIKKKKGQEKKAIVMHGLTV